MPTKQALLLSALENKRTVTRANAMIAFRIPNLTAVLSDLRRQGHKIKAIRVASDGNGQPYTKWVLVNAPTNQRPPLEPSNALSQPVGRPYSGL